MSRRKKHRQPSPHPYLAQMLYRSIGASQAFCHTRTHQDPVLARWEVRVYQNWDRTMDLTQPTNCATRLLKR